MEAVILAAGRGTRLRPLTDTVPKAMVPVNGKPMLEIILRQLKEVGVTKIVIVTHHLKEKIEEYFGDGSTFGLQIKYAYQEEMKGNADAVLRAELFISGTRFLCLACDSLFPTNLLQHLLSHNSPGVITAKPVDDVRRYGILFTSGNAVTEIVEKPATAPTNLANFSVYVLPREIFAACKQIAPAINDEYSLTDAINHLINRGIRFEYVTEENILDIGTQEQLAEASILAQQLGL